MVWELIVIFIIGYLIGSINLSIIISKLMGKGDIRNYGSGNAGTTNTLRVLGKGPAILVLIFDICKAVIAILIAKLIFKITDVSLVTDGIYSIEYELGVLLAAFGAILGHNFPIYFGFKGGKGIATSLGALLMIEWPIGLSCGIFAILLMVISRMVSLGSILGAMLYPILVLVMGSVFGTSFTNKAIYVCFAILLAGLAIYRHKSNIKRLLNGTENKLWKTKEEKALEAQKQADEEKKEEAN